MIGGNITNIEKIISEQKMLAAKINDLEKKLKNMPKGELACWKNGNSYKWHMYLDGESRYIYKRERKLAEQLALKKYYMCQLEDAYKEQKAVESYLSKCPYPKKSEILLSEESGFRELLKPCFMPIDEELSEWAIEEYDRNTNHLENLKFKTSNGYYVRSKSEAMIDKILSINQIPFRYECELSLNGMIIYPDFTIRHPKTGDYYYWEHFGMMDNASYANGAILKLQSYVANNIFPTINLITTYETKENPLDMSTIEEIVQKYFL